MRALPEIRLYSPGRTGETSYDNIPFGSDSCPPAERWDGRLLDSGHLRVEHPACVCPALALLGGVTFLSGDGRVFLSRDDKRRLCCHGVPQDRKSTRLNSSHLVISY